MANKPILKSIQVLNGEGASARQNVQYKKALDNGNQKIKQTPLHQLRTF